MRRRVTWSNVTRGWSCPLPQLLPRRGICRTQIGRRERTRARPTPQDRVSKHLLGVQDVDVNRRSKSLVFADRKYIYNNNNNNKKNWRIQIIDQAQQTRYETNNTAQGNHSQMNNIYDTSKTVLISNVRRSPRTLKQCSQGLKLSPSTASRGAGHRCQHTKRTGAISDPSRRA